MKSEPEVDLYVFKWHFGFRVSLAKLYVHLGSAQNPRMKHCSAALITMYSCAAALMCWQPAEIAGRSVCHPGFACAHDHVVTFSILPPIHLPDRVLVGG